MQTIDQVRDALNARKGEWPRICEETGLGYSWLTKFAQGTIKNPTLNNFAPLAAYLSEPPGAA